METLYATRGYLEVGRHPAEIPADQQLRLFGMVGVLHSDQARIFRYFVVLGRTPPGGCRGSLEPRKHVGNNRNSHPVAYFYT